MSYQSVEIQGVRVVFRNLPKNRALRADRFISLEGRDFLYRENKDGRHVVYTNMRRIRERVRHASLGYGDAAEQTIGIYGLRALAAFGLIDGPSAEETLKAAKWRRTFECRVNDLKYARDMLGDSVKLSDEDIDRLASEYADQKAKEQAAKSRAP